MTPRETLLAAVALLWIILALFGLSKPTGGSWRRMGRRTWGRGR